MGAGISPDRLAKHGKKLKGAAALRAREGAGDFEESVLQ